MSKGNVKRNNGSECAMDSKYKIRILKKVFNDGFKGYWFNVPKFINESSKYESNEIVVKLQMIEQDEEKCPTEEALRKRLLRVRKFCEGLIGEKDGKEESFSINVVKEFGEALCNDEYAFLIPIELSTVIQTAEYLKGDDSDNDLRTIYDMLNAILYELEASAYYNYQPGTRNDGMAYYDIRFQEIRRAIDSRFWNKREMKNKLYQIVEEEEALVRSCSVPGVAEHWYEYNPRLRYFDCVFEFIEQAPELYEEIKQKNQVEKSERTIGFNFYPSESDIQSQKNYFAEIEDKCQRDNRVFSWDRIYQNELVNTLSIIFEHEFSETNEESQ